MHLDDDLVIGAHPRRRLLERGVSEHELAGPLWRATGSGRYAFAGTDADDPRQRTREAAARLPPTGAVGGWAAGHLHGAHELDGRGPWGRSKQPVLACLTPRHHLATGEGLRISRSRMDEDDVTCVDGVRCTTLVRTAFDLARLTPDWREAVVALDVLLRCTDVDLGDVWRTATSGADGPAAVSCCRCCRWSTRTRCRCPRRAYACCGGAGRPAAHSPGQPAHRRPVRPSPGPGRSAGRGGGTRG